jgi:PAS domain S-box-containing protein
LCPKGSDDGQSISIFDWDAETAIVFANHGRVQKRWSERSVFSSKLLLDSDFIELQQGNIHLVDDVVDQPPTLPAIQEMQASGLRSYVMVPLLAQEALIGSLNLGSDQPHAFTSDQIEVAREIADQLAIAVQQAHFVAQIRHYAAELEQRVVERTAELQRTKEHVEAILNNSSDAIILLNDDGTIQQINPAFTALFGYSTDDFNRLSLSLLVEPGEVDVVMGTLATVVKTSKPIRIEAICQRADVTHFAADIALAAILKGNAIQGVVCSLRDITERKQLEHDLRTSLEKERELNELKSRFTTMISHEFRNPLAAILSSNNLVKSYSHRMSEERKQTHHEQIQEQGMRLVSFLDEILWISKAQSVGLDFQPAPINLDAFCRRLCDEMQQMVGIAHQIVFRSGGEPVEVLGDEKLLRQAITNLLTNAIKYSPHGGEVLLALATDMRQAVIQVADQGIGIPEDDQKHLFETFYRAKNVGAIPGTGLGLTIVKQAVEAHQGIITVMSESGAGTTFTIQLPIM